MKKIKNKILRFFRFLYLKLFRINDSPQKIALGLGLGVFLGILPGTGPIASLSLAFVFRINRASALLGSLLTNTWLSFVTFILAIKIGSFMLKLNWQETYSQYSEFLKSFHWADLFKLSVLKMLFPLLIGYLIISLALGLLAYLAALIILKLKRK
ncbi:MAG: DUF2062 domain-containing protein [Candidatus Omnitrophica bacterium]|nr:DUF2062 domain-containing protein [Candidatus Omnitrophota bacterium]